MKCSGGRCECGQNVRLLTGVGGPPAEDEEWSNGRDLKD